MNYKSKTRDANQMIDQKVEDINHLISQNPNLSRMKKKIN